MGVTLANQQPGRRVRADIKVEYNSTLGMEKERNTKGQEDIHENADKMGLYEELAEYIELVIVGHQNRTIIYHRNGSLRGLLTFPAKGELLADFFTSQT